MLRDDGGALSFGVPLLGRDVGVVDDEPKSAGDDGGCQRRGTPRAEGAAWFAPIIENHHCQANPRDQVGGNEKRGPEGPRFLTVLDDGAGVG